MPLIEWIHEIFPLPQAPFTAAEIVRRLQQLYSPCVTRDAVYDAIRSLKERPATSQTVQALDDCRPAFYSADAARLVARYVTRNMEPDRFPQPIKIEETPPAKKTSASFQLPADSEPTTAKEPIAA